jgi:hypothetical protein
MNLANEGLEARKKDEEIALRKRKAEEDKQWEGTQLSFVAYIVIHVLFILQRIESIALIVGGVFRTRRKRRKQKSRYLVKLGFNLLILYLPCPIRNYKYLQTVSVIQ